MNDERGLEVGAEFPIDKPMDLFGDAFRIEQVDVGAGIEGEVEGKGFFLSEAPNIFHQAEGRRFPVESGRGGSGREGVEFEGFLFQKVSKGDLIPLRKNAQQLFGSLLGDTVALFPVGVLLHGLVTAARGSLFLLWGDDQHAVPVSFECRVKFGYANGIFIAATAGGFAPEGGAGAEGAAGAATAEATQSGSLAKKILRVVHSRGVLQVQQAQGQGAHAAGGTGDPRRVGESVAGVDDQVVAGQKREQGCHLMEIFFDSLTEKIVLFALKKIFEGVPFIRLGGDGGDGFAGVQGETDGGVGGNLNSLLAPVFDDGNVGGGFPSDGLFAHVQTISRQGMHRL